MPNSILIPLLLIVANVLLFIRLKGWQMFGAFLPAFLLLVIVVATLRDKLVMWRVL